MDSRQINWPLLGLFRFFLAWIVLCGHRLWFVDAGSSSGIFTLFGGKAAVLGFMVISGFSIANSLNRGEEGFYRRRFLRIYPIYFVIVAMAEIIAFVYGPIVQVRDHVFIQDSTFTFVGNLLLLQMFLCRAIAYSPAVWSLSIECFYYLLAPIFRRMKVSKLLILVLISGIAYVLPKHDNWGSVYSLITKMHPLRYLWSWLLGFLLWRTEKSLYYILGMLFGVVLILLDVNDHPLQTEWLSSLTYLLSIGIIAFSSFFPKFSGKGKWAANFLGDLSYPLYLAHIPIFIVAYVAFQTHNYLLLSLFAFIGSTVLYWLVDLYIKPRYLKPLIL